MPFTTERSSDDPAEKCTKAVLVHLQISFPVVHDLGMLVALQLDDKMPPEGFGIVELNPYATVRRYEEGLTSLTTEEIETSLTTARKVATWATDTTTL